MVHNCVRFFLFSIFVFGRIDAQVFSVGSLSEEPFCKADLFRVNLETLERSKLFSIPQGYVVWNHEIRPSKEDELTAFIMGGRIEKDPRNVPFEQKKLVVIDGTGAIQVQFDGAQRFAWSPDGKKLVYLKGIKYEGFGFLPESLIVSSPSGNVTLAIKVTKDQHISWASHDGMVYTTDYGKVYRYNPVSGEKQVVKYKGIDFSPDGKYYFKPSYEGGEIGVFESSSNRDISPAFFKKEEPNFLQWLPDEYHKLAAGDAFRKKTIIDVQTGITEATIEGVWLGYTKKRGQIVFHKGGSIESVRISIQKE